MTAHIDMCLNILEKKIRCSLCKGQPFVTFITLDKGHQRMLFIGWSLSLAYIPRKKKSAVCEARYLSVSLGTRKEV